VCGEPAHLLDLRDDQRIRRAEVLAGLPHIAWHRLDVNFRHPHLMTATAISEGSERSVARMQQRHGDGTQRRAPRNAILKVGSQDAER
jgi:hypothetical protein